LYKNSTPSTSILYYFGVVFFLGFLSVGLFYWTATERFYPTGRKRFFILFPAFLVISMGLSLHNTVAVLEGWLGIKTPFMRTPKFNIVAKKDPYMNNTYLKPDVNLITLVEGVLCLYFVFGIVKGIQMENTGMLLFHTMLALGFGTVFLLSIKPWANA
jgi:hypothetical protein